MTEIKIRKWRDLDHEGRARCRFDFASEVLSTDDQTQTAQIRLEPDPRRYRLDLIDGENCYVDKFLNTAIPEGVVFQMMEAHLIGLPLSYGPPSITSSSEYAKSRRFALKDELDGAPYSPPTEKAKAHEELQANSVDSFISFLSIDILGGTALQQAYGGKFDEAYQIFLRELSTSVGHFHGSILNVTGDGFIAYIDMPRFTTQCDNTVDLGLTLLRVLQDAINPSLKQAGLPTLRIRVGADVGKAVRRNIAVEATNFRSFDFGSAALNRAVKIEQAAGAGQFLIGQALYELLHVFWLERCQLIPFSEHKIGLAEYKSYLVT